jgi:uncharacterized membrane protein
MVAIRHGTLTARRVPEQPPAAMKRHRVLLSATIWSSHHRAERGDSRQWVCSSGEAVRVVLRLPRLRS